MIKDACELKECPECGSTNVVCNKQRNQLICRDCGVIYEPMAPAREEQFERASGLAKAKPKKTKTRAGKKKKR